MGDSMRTGTDWREPHRTSPPFRKKSGATRTWRWTAIGCTRWARCELVDAPGGKAPVLSLELASLGSRSALGEFDERGAKGPGTWAGSRVAAPAAALVVAGATPGPRGQTFLRAEGIDVRAERDQDHGGSVAAVFTVIWCPSILKLIVYINE